MQNKINFFIHIYLLKVRLSAEWNGWWTNKGSNFILTSRPTFTRYRKFKKLNIACQVLFNFTKRYLFTKWFTNSFINNIKIVDKIHSSVLNWMYCLTKKPIYGWNWVIGHILLAKGTNVEISIGQAIKASTHVCQFMYVLYACLSFWQ